MKGGVLYVNLEISWLATQRQADEVLQLFKFKSHKFQSALLSSSNFELLTLCQAESDENARYSPGSVVYLGKQNRVRCRAAAVSSKALINEDSKMRFFDSLTGNPMKIHPEIK